VKQFIISVDESGCWGCRTCEVACKQELYAAPGVQRIVVWEDGPRMVEGRLDTIFRVRLCRHCEDPLCAGQCPVEAIQRRDDGIVVLDSKACTGCGICIEDCPFDAIAFDIDNEIAVKCNLCHHRIDHGLVPACADNVCLAHCLHFGRREEEPLGSV
jgi:Fe-S-cluster-containing dehydrogenase component